MSDQIPAPTLVEPADDSVLKPKVKQNLSEEERTRWADRMREINQKRIDSARARKEAERIAKLPPQVREAEPVDDKDLEFEAAPPKRKYVKKAPKPEAEEPEPEPEPEPKKVAPKKAAPKKAEPKKAAPKKKVVYETEEEEDESEDELIVKKVVVKKKSEKSAPAPPVAPAAQKCRFF